MLSLVYFTVDVSERSGIGVYLTPHPALALNITLADLCFSICPA